MTFLESATSSCFSLRNRSILEIIAFLAFINATDILEIGIMLPKIHGVKYFQTEKAAKQSSKSLGILMELILFMIA